MSASAYYFLSCKQISQEVGKMVWYSHLLKNFPQFVVIHTVKGFGIVNKTEVDVFPKLSCFFYNPTDAGKFVSGSSAFSKSSLNIWKFSVHILLKSHLENFEHYFASMGDECGCAEILAFFGIPFLWDCNENWPFPALCHCWVFQICWHIECSTLTASSFRSQRNTIRCLWGMRTIDSGKASWDDQNMNK